MNVHTIILAAGQGSRMKSNKAKVLQRIGGTSMLHQICSTAGKISPKITLVVGFDKDSVIKEADEYGVPDLEEVIALQSKMGEFMIKLKENMDHNFEAMAELLKEQADFLTLINERIALLEDSFGSDRTLN